MVRLTTHFAVRLTPRGGADRIEGVDEAGVLRVRVRPAPVDGAANDALIRLLAEELDVPRSSVSIESGATGRRKRVSIAGVSPAQLGARWPGIEAA
ncbi:DUF167 domain-containing protein [soil metagenome]